MSVSSCSFLLSFIFFLVLSFWLVPANVLGQANVLGEGGRLHTEKTTENEQKHWARTSRSMALHFCS